MLAGMSNHGVYETLLSYFTFRFLDFVAHVFLNILETDFSIFARFLAL